MISVVGSRARKRAILSLLRALCCSLSRHMRRSFQFSVICSMLSILVIVPIVCLLCLRYWFIALICIFVYDPLSRLRGSAGRVELSPLRSAG
jgi:hypothetical protein